MMALNGQAAMFQLGVDSKLLVFFLGKDHAAATLGRKKSGDDAVAAARIGGGQPHVAASCSPGFDNPPVPRIFSLSAGILANFAWKTGTVFTIKGCLPPFQINVIMPTNGNLSQSVT